MNQLSIPKYLYYLVSALLFGLIIHFISINFLEFVVWLPRIVITAISLRKELAIAGLMWCILRYNIALYGLSGRIKKLKTDTFFRYLLMGFVVVVAISLLSSIFNGSVLQFPMAFRYDYVPFVLLLLAYQVAKVIPSERIKFLTRVYIEVIRRLIWLGLIWYFIISSLPGALKIFWYDKMVFEGELGQRPPAVYYAALDHGAPRNQSLRERPIFYGFYLVAFWPLFFFLYLKKAPRAEQVFFGGLYMLNVFSTFSRSARIVRIFLTVLIFFLVYGKKALKYLKYLFIPILWLGALVGVFFYYEIFWPGRQFSNTWHINAFFEAVRILKTHWLWWLGAWSAWPASHQLWIGFNPENQYLQIRVEYGIFGFIARTIYYGYLNISWLFKKWRNGAKSYLQDMDVLHWDNRRLALLSFNIGMIWLSICGLMLHSLADKMVFRPFMILFGLWLGMKKD